MVLVLRWYLSIGLSLSWLTLSSGILWAMLKSELRSAFRSYIGALKADTTRRIHEILCLEDHLRTAPAYLPRSRAMAQIIWEAISAYSQYRDGGLRRPLRRRLGSDSLSLRRESSRKRRMISQPCCTIMVGFDCRDTQIDSDPWRSEASVVER